MASTRERQLVATAIGAIGLALLAACSTAQSSNGAADRVTGATSGSSKDMAAFDASASGAEPATVSLLSQNSAGNRALIAQARLSLFVNDVAKTRVSVLTIASDAGGYVSREETSATPASNSSRPNAGSSTNPAQTSTLVIRVPTSATAATLVRLQKLGTVDAIEQQTTDVTTRVADVNARVRSAAASVARVRALLSRAQTIGQVVQIEGQLASRQATLESLQAQQRSLADQTSYATITVVLQATDATAVAAATGFGAGLSNGWSSFTKAFTVGLTAVGWILPFALFLVVVIAFVAAGRVLFRRRRSVLT